MDGKEVAKNTLENLDSLQNQVNSQNISIEEKIRILESLGFTIRNGRVYY